MKTHHSESRRLFAAAVIALGLIAVPRVYGQVAPSCRSVIPQTIGVAAYRCASCSMESRRDGSDILLFDAEPVVTEVLPPSGARRVQVGDVIVSVNGKPITTRDAGVALSNPPTGTLHLGVRRNGSHINLEFMVPLRCTGPGGPLSLDAATIYNGSIRQDPDVEIVVSWQDGVARFVEREARLQRLQSVQRVFSRSADSIFDLRTSFQRFYRDAQSIHRLDEALRGMDSALKAVDSVVARMRTLSTDTSLGRRLQALATQSNQLEATSSRLRTLIADRYARTASITSNLGFAVGCVEICSRQSDAAGNAYWRYNAHPVVTSVREQSPAERAGLRAGDRISAVDDRSILTDDGAIAFERAAGRDAGTMRLTVIRDGRPVTLTIQLGGR